MIPTKYHSRKTTIDGLTFDSKKEADKYAELKLLQRAGEVLEIQLQPVFILQVGYWDKNKKWVRPITYRADFRVVYKDGRVEFIDTKGHRTKDYLLKRKMLLYHYSDINFREE